MGQSVPAFLFPTRVALIDDSADFLANLSLQLPSHLALRALTSPIDALVEINGRPVSHTAVDRAFSLYEHRDELQSGRHVIAIRLDAIASIIADPQRFSTISVVVVDYDMAEMNGLEFCRNLRNPAIRKILLTGKADEQVAIEAFNEGLIDRFIRKQAPDAIPSLVRAITQLQAKYFEIAEHTLSEALALGPQRFLADPAFLAEFGALRQRLSIIEHYLMCSPDSLLLVNQRGRLWRLVVTDAEGLRSAAEIAEALNAPGALVAAIAAGQEMPSQALDGPPQPVTPQDWARRVVPATAITSSPLGLRYALVENPPTLLPGGLYPYAQYLDELDAQPA